MREQDSPYIQLYADEKKSGDYPLPTAIVDAALAHLQSDGAVLWYDEQNNEWSSIEPCEQISLENLAPDTFARYLDDLTQVIEGGVIQIANFPEMTMPVLKNLAHYLSQFSENPAFIQYAASLLQVEDNHMRCTHVPLSSPQIWVPQLREQLTSIG